jgi:hypothetical protein
VVGRSVNDAGGPCPRLPLATLGARSSFAISTGPREQGYGGQLAPTAQDGPIVFVRFPRAWAMLSRHALAGIPLSEADRPSAAAGVKAEDDPYRPSAALFFGNR